MPGPIERRLAERRQDSLTPIREQRDADRRDAPRVPEWRRRALAARDQHGFLAVADLTGKVA